MPLLHLQKGFSLSANTEFPVIAVGKKDVMDWMIPESDHNWLMTLNETPKTIYEQHFPDFMVVTAKEIPQQYAVLKK